LVCLGVDSAGSFHTRWFVLYGQMSEKVPELQDPRREDGGLTPAFRGLPYKRRCKLSLDQDRCSGNWTSYFYLDLAKLEMMPDVIPHDATIAAVNDSPGG
jgi:hypothetical protein